MWTPWEIHWPWTSTDQEIFTWGPGIKDEGVRSKEDEISIILSGLGKHYKRQISLSHRKNSATSCGMKAKICRQHLLYDSVCISENGQTNSLLFVFCFWTWPRSSLGSVLFSLAYSVSRIWSSCRETWWWKTLHLSYCTLIPDEQ